MDETSSGDLTTTLTVTDAAGNTASCNAVVTVEDAIDPVLVACPEPQTLVVETGCTVEAFWLAPLMSDNCTEVIYTVSTDDAAVRVTDLGMFAYTEFPIGTTTVTYIAVDGSGNDAACSFTITVEDLTPPTLTGCPPNQTVFTTTGACDAPAFWPAIQANDNCIEGLTVNASHQSGDIFPVGATLVTFTVSDQQGNVSDPCTFTVTVVDGEVPSLDCPTTVVAVATGNCTYAMPDVAAIVTGSDNCDASVSPIQQIPAGTATTASTIVQVSATDNAGNVGVCQVTVMVPAMLVATISNSTDATCNGIADGSATVDVTGGTAPYTYLWNDANAQTDGTAVALAAGTYDVVVTDANGCTTTASVTIGEAAPLTYTTGAAAASCDNGTDGVAFINVTGGTTPYTYLWDDANAQTTAAISGLPAGEYTVVVTDNNGCMATATIVVGGLDVTPPTALCHNAVVALDANGMATITAATVNNGSFDDCAIATIDLDITSFDCSDIGDNTVTLTVTDVNGMSASCMATVTVIDNLGAVLPVCGQTITLYLDASGTASLTTDLLGAPVDNCTPSGDVQVVINSSILSFDGDDLGQTYTYGATTFDAAGNDETCQFQVAITDVIPPTAICQNIVVFLDANGQVGITPTQIDNGSFDNVAIAEMALSVDQFDCSTTGVNATILTVTDAVGLTASCSAQVTVIDNTLPTAVCQEATIVLDENGQATLAYADVDGGSSDNCGISIQQLSQTAFDCTHLGTNTVTYDIFDPTGNRATCTATVTVVDETAPTLAACTDGITLYLAPNGEATLTVADLGVPADNCDPAPVVEIVGGTSFTCLEVGVQNRFVAITDASSNSTLCQVAITVRDTTPPVAVCQDVTVVLGADGIATLDASDVDNGSNDACGIASLSLDVTDFSCADIGGGGGGAETLAYSQPDENVFYAASAYAQTFLAAGSGNISRIEGLRLYTRIPGQTFTATVKLIAGTDPLGTNVLASGTVDVTETPTVFTVNFQTPPAVTIGQGYTLIIQPPAGIPLSLGGTGAFMAGVPNGDTYPDGNIILVYPGFAFPFAASDLAFRAVISDGGGNTFSGNTVNLTVTDNNGNVSTCTSNVTVIDQTPPVMVCTGVTVDLDANGQASITTAMIDGGSADVCGDITLALDQTEFDCSHVGANTVILSGTDASGNTATCTAQVIVQDNLAPTLAACGTTLQPALDANGQFTLTTADLGTSMDNCGVASIAILGQTIFDCDDLSASVSVGVSILDVNGNASLCDVNVQIIDVTLPQAICIANVLIDLDANGVATLTPDAIDAGSFDNCGIADMSLSQTDFDCSHTSAPVNVTLTVIDASGNADNCITAVVVQDNTAPEVVCTPNLTVQLGADGSATIEHGDVVTSAGDNCDIEVALALDSYQFDCDDLGTQTVTATATDDSGNTATCTTVVTVEDNVAPIVTFCGQTFTIELDASGTAEFTEDLLGVITDNCGGYSVMFFGPTTYTVADINTTDNLTVVVMDDNLNPVACTIYVSVLDGGAPTAICQDITIDLDANGQAAITPDMINNGSFDIGGIANMTVSQTDFNCDHIGMNTVTLSVTDQGGNSDQCTATVTVRDVIGPDMVCQDVTVYLDANGQASITTAMIDGGSTDACDAEIDLVLNNTDFTCDNLGDNMVSLTGTDDEANKTICMATVTVVDNTAPTLADCGTTLLLSLDAYGEAVLTVDMLSTPLDNCGSATVTILGQTAYDCLDTDPVAVPLAITDGSGNVTTCTVMVGVVDNIDPVAECNNLTIVLDEDGLATLDAEQAGVGSMDNCGTATLTYSLDITEVSCDDLAGGTVELTVTDAAGNADNCTLMVTVLDNTAPTTICRNVTIYLDENGMASITTADVNNGSYDNCGIASMTLSQIDFDCSMVGINNVVLTTTDAAGNSSTCTAQVTVVDNIVPIPDFCGQVFDLALDANGTAILNESTLGISDNCGAVTLYFTSRTTYTCADLGTTRLVTVYIIDAANNYTVCNFYVHIVDTIAPVATCQDISVQLDADGNVSISPDMVETESTDNCAVVGRSLDVDQFTCADLDAPQNVTLTVVDASGNTGTCTATVTMEDNVAPTVTCRSVNAFLDAEGNASINPLNVLLMSDDACGVTSMMLDRTSFDCDDIGMQTVTLTVMDGSGNSAQCTANVNIVDTYVPLPDYCGDILEVELDPSGTVSLATYPAITEVVDNCTPLAVYFTASTSFNCSNVGQTVLRTLYFVDGYNNYSVCNTYITITDPNGYCVSPLVAQDIQATEETAVDTKNILGTSDDKGIQLRVLPNPFSEQVQLVYQLAKDSEVEISIWSTMGQLMTGSKPSRQLPGSHNFIWQPNAGVSAGVYLVRLTIDGEVEAIEHLIYQR
ncbi:MAG: HYR domain-containing protein [Saprospiraceae bacterium]